MSTDLNYPRTRDARRRQYKNLVAEFSRPTMRETIAAVRFQLDLTDRPHGTRRRSDPPEKGAWYPPHVLCAMAQALIEVERELARRERQPAQRVAS